MTMTTPAKTRIDGETALTAWREGAILIDVRSEQGRRKNGEVQGAVIVAKSDVVDFVTRRLKGRSARQPVLLFCGSVAGTAPLIEALVAAGETGVADVEGGFAALTGANGLAVIQAVPA
jgi:rhodanese-related sulfurtransferase